MCILYRLNALLCSWRTPKYSQSKGVGGGALRHTPRSEPSLKGEDNDPTLDWGMVLCDEERNTKR